MHKTLDEKLEKIRNYKKPTILMNDNDFEAFKKQIEAETNIKLGSFPTYRAIPVKTSQFVSAGNVLIYDEFVMDWFKK